MLERVVVGLAAGLLLSFPAAAMPSSSCGTPSFHPLVPGPASAALRARSGLPPLPGTPNYFAGGCAVRPSYSQTMQSNTYPITLHFESAHAAMATKVLGWMETSWDVETSPVATGGLEFPVPAGDLALGGGTDRMDVYLEPSQYGGYYCPETYVYGTDYIATSGWISINPELNDDSFTSAAVAHELHHAIQFGIDAHEDPSFMEMTSAYVMEVVYDQENAAGYFIPEFQQYPHYSLDYFDYGAPYQYGASMWLFWLLDDLYSSDSANALRFIWMNARQPYDASGTNEPDYFDVMSELLLASNLDLGETYAMFAGDRWFTGDAHDGTFAEGGSYPGPDIARTYSAGNLPGGDITLPDDTAEFGTSYVKINLGSPSPEATMTFTWDLDPQVEWTVLSLRADRSANDRSVIGTSATGTEIFGAFNGESEIVLAFVNRGDGNHDPDNDDWVGNPVTFSVSYDDPSAPGGGDGEPLGCSFAADRTPTASTWSSALVVLGATFLIRRRRSCV